MKTNIAKQEECIATIFSGDRTRNLSLIYIPAYRRNAAREISVTKKRAALNDLQKFFGLFKLVFLVDHYRNMVEMKIPKQQIFSLLKNLKPLSETSGFS